MNETRRAKSRWIVATFSARDKIVFFSSSSSFSRVSLHFSIPPLVLELDNLDRPSFPERFLTLYFLSAYAEGGPENENGKRNVRHQRRRAKLSHTLCFSRWILIFPSRNFQTGKQQDAKNTRKDFLLTHFISIFSFYRSLEKSLYCLYVPGLTIQITEMTLIIQS